MSDTKTTIKQLVRLGEGSALYNQALTHRSVAGAPHNERLEFLGDAVIELLVTELLLAAFPGAEEGRLAKLRAAVVDTESLAILADLADLQKILRVGPSANGKVSKRVLASAVEAIVGAQYQLFGFKWIRGHYSDLFTELIEGATLQPARHQAKTVLQEATVAKFGLAPLYMTTGQGPAHRRHFTSRVVFKVGEAYGQGPSKKQAEQDAAWNALKKLGVVT